MNAIFFLHRTITMNLIFFLCFTSIDFLLYWYSFTWDRNYTIHTIWCTNGISVSLAASSLLCDMEISIGRIPFYHSNYSIFQWKPYTSFDFNWFIQSNKTLILIAMTNRNSTQQFFFLLSIISFSLADSFLV